MESRDLARLGTGACISEDEPYKRCLRENSRLIIDNMNVWALLPNLMEKGLLTREEREQIEAKTTDYDRNCFVYSKLYTKGEEGFKRFLQCLRDEHEHLGHKDLVKTLGLSIQTPIHV